MDFLNFFYSIWILIEILKHFLGLFNWNTLYILCKIIFVCKLHFDEMIAQIVATIIKIKPNYYLNFNPQYKKLKELILHR